MLKRNSRFRIVLCLAALLTCLGCGVEQTLEDLARETGEPSAPSPEAGGTPASDTIKIASFNIQVFGVSKLQKQPVMDVLCQVVRRFDLVAVQEVRAKDQSVVPQFVDLINADGSRYDYVLGPRLGRTSSKEQYVFLFDTSRIEVDRNSVFTLADPDDRLHREPLVARFRTRGVSAREAFTFTLMNIHTDPDETDWELDALDDMFTSVQRNAVGEDDVILLGDLNVDERHLGELGTLPGIAWIVRGQPTNTLGTKSYDNVVFDHRATVEHTGYWGIVDLMGDYGLTVDQAMDVSDHLPVWAEFSVREGSSEASVAARHEEPVR